MQFAYKRLFWFLIVSLILFLPPLSGQEKEIRRAERKKELVEKLQKKYHEKTRRKTIKHRREIQTKATKNRMKQTDKKAKVFNRDEKTFRKWWHHFVKKSKH